MMGCSTGYVIRESSRSLDDLRAAIFSISGQPRRSSENKRTFISNYFARKKDPNFDPAKSKERLYAVFTILGDRRPYDVQVQVFAEEKIAGVHQPQGVDDAFSIQIANELKRELNKRPEDRSVIDDFRAF